MWELIAEWEAKKGEGVPTHEEQSWPALAELQTMRGYHAKAARAAELGLADCYVRYARTRRRQASALASTAFYNKALDVATTYQDRRRQRAILQESEHAARAAVGEMKTIEARVPVPEEELDRLVSWIAERGPEEALDRLIEPQPFYPRISKLRKEREAGKARPVLAGLFDSLTLKDGRVEAKVAAGDVEGRLISNDMVLGFQVYFQLLPSVLRALRRKTWLGASHVIHCLSKGAVGRLAGRGLAYRAVEHFFEEEWEAACHLLVPQIEALVRRALGLTGEVTRRARPRGIAVERALGDMLFSTRVDSGDCPLWDVLGEDLCTALRTLLVDPRGLNFRNDLCHGLVKPEQCEEAMASLLLYFLLMLNRAVAYAEEHYGERPGESQAQDSPE